MKRYLILGIIILAAAGLVAGGYLLRKNDSSAISPGQNNNQAQNPPLDDGSKTGQGTGNTGQGLGGLLQKSNQVAENLVKDYFVDAQGKIVFIQPDGRIFSSEGGSAVGGAAGDKTPKTINSTAIGNLIDVSFSFDGKMVAARFGNLDKPQTSVFDIEKKAWVPLALDVQALAWSPEERQLAYLAKTAQGLTLGILDFSQKSIKPKDLISLHANDLILGWIKPGEVWLSEKPTSKIEGTLWSFNFSTKTLTKVIDQQKGLETIWNAGGALALKSSGNQLEIIDRRGNLSRRLAFRTLLSKCVFFFEMKNATTTTAATGTKKSALPQVIKEEYLNCAIPTDATQLQGYSLPDDYYKKAVFTEDNIYQIELSSGDITPLFVGDGVDAINLKRVGQKIYFINRFDNKLYSAPIAAN